MESQSVYESFMICLLHPLLINHRFHRLMDNREEAGGSSSSSSSPNRSNQDKKPRTSDEVNETSLPSQADQSTSSLFERALDQVLIRHGALPHEDLCALSMTCQSLCQVRDIWRHLHLDSAQYEGAYLVDESSSAVSLVATCMQSCLAGHPHPILRLPLPLPLPPRILMLHSSSGVALGRPSAFMGVLPSSRPSISSRRR